MTESCSSFKEPLLEWFNRHGRHDLPWQINPTAYRVWLSEIMLQQTQVATVIPYYLNFLQHFPDIRCLAESDLDGVLQHWQGLGYYARARNLHRSARIICDRFDGEFPQSMDEVTALPGIGRSTAAAILTFACGQSWPILDGNVKRVLARYFEVPGWYGQTDTNRKLWQLSEKVTPQQKTADFNQAMMDLGSMVCVRTKPLCEQCPLTDHCQSYRNGTQQQYPQKKPGKTKPQKQTLMLLHRYEDQVLLYRRPPTGIWGGLWSLPEVDRAEAINDWQQTQFSRSFPYLSISENQMRHQFTHFSLDISVALFDLEQLPERVGGDQTMQFVPLDKIADFGLPAPVRKIVDRLQGAQ